MRNPSASASYTPGAPTSPSKKRKLSVSYPAPAEIPKSVHLPKPTGVFLPSNRKASVQPLLQPAKKPVSTDLHAESFLLGVAAFDREKRSQNIGRKMVLSTDPKITAALIAHHHTRLRPLAALSYPQIAPHLPATSIQFEPVTSDIIIRKPFLSANAVHIYIPSVAVGLVVERLEMAAKQMGNGGTYSVESVLNFLGEKCACGQRHWESMGWNSGEGVCWPEELGVNKEGVQMAVKQLRVILSQAWVPKMRLDGEVAGFAAPMRGGTG